MPAPRTSSDLSKIGAVLRGRAADQVPVMLSPRQYVWLILATCALIGMLIMPLIMTFVPKATWTKALVQFGSLSVGITSQLGVNYVLRYCDNPVRHWYDQRPFWVNILLRIVPCLAVAAAYGVLQFYLHRYLGIRDEHPRLINAVAGSQVFAFIIILIQVAVETMERSQHLTIENQRLKQDQLQARYEGLKQQLSPHFLFNSLSTLGGLVYESPRVAEKFIEEMAHVYRYLLQHGEHTTVPLAEELTFLRSYCYLLQMRFGESLQLELDLPVSIQNRLLPPLALQLLVENAVKHNVLTRRQPLRIRIEFCAPATLVVRNNRQPRLTPEPSSGVGLSNLTTRLRIHHQELLVEQAAAEFRVYLPLPA